MSARYPLRESQRRRERRHRREGAGTRGAGRGFQASTRSGPGWVDGRFASHCAPEPVERSAPQWSFGL